MRASDQDKESMFSLIRKWQASGMSQKTFCKEHDLRYHVFHYWYSQFRVSTAEGSSVPGRFIHLQTSSSTPDVFVEVNFTGGSSIIFHQPVSADYLKALL